MSENKQQKEEQKMLALICRHRGRRGQIPIYVGKFFRMFGFQSDWKVLPMAALIAGLVAMVTGENMFETMEGTFQGSFALACICMWNGFFNSIQSVCRERAIVKREHRAGLHISSYIAAHMIYQAFLCLCQTLITIFVCLFMNVDFPTEGFITPFFLVDFGISLFLITYAADMTSLLISCIVKDTTSAMTVMPFMLIVELVFSGAMFSLPDWSSVLTDCSLLKWGLQVLCAQSDYNSQRMVSVWNQIFKFRNYEIAGLKPVKAFVEYMEENDLVNEFEYETAIVNQNSSYALTKANVFGCWGRLILIALVCAAAAVLILEFIDHDKR